MQRTVFLAKFVSQVPVGGPEIDGARQLARATIARERHPQRNHAEHSHLTERETLSCSTAGTCKKRDAAPRGCTD